jgi:hypothetical protein
MGDDVHAASNNMHRAMMAICQYQLNGHELQASKQLIGQQAEFLRIAYTTKGVRGNLARTCGSFVGSDLQSPETVYTPEFVKGTATAACGLWRRGADEDFVNRLISVCSQHFARVKLDDGSTVGLTNLEWLYASERSGGIGVVRTGEVGLDALNVYRRHESVKIPDKLPGAKDHGIAALLAYAKQRLIKSELQTDVLDDIATDARRSTYAGALNPELQKQYNTSSKEWAAKYYNELNNTKCTIRAHYPELPEPAKLAIHNVVRDAKDADPKQITDFEAVDLEALAEAAISTSLGLLGTSRGLLSKVRDVHSGARIGVLQAMERLSPERSGFRKLVSICMSTYGERFATWLFSSSAHILADNGGMICPELNPIVHMAHQAAVPIIRDHIGEDALMADVTGFTTSINNELVFQYRRQGLFERYRM